MRIAAVGDFHCGEADQGKLREKFAAVNGAADVLLLAGDLTRRGTEAEFVTVANELAGVRVPVVAVLGNHDHESGLVSRGTAILREHGITVLCGDAHQVDDQLGVAGTKGFMGGFGRGTLTAFGEPETKAFVAAAISEQQNLELALRNLGTPVRVALVHYSPILATIAGEPEIIHPFLGTDRLGTAIDRHGATVCFHGHAHSGAFRGETLSGVPVFNVSLPVLHRDGIGEMFYVHEIPLPVADQQPAGATAGADD